MKINFLAIPLLVFAAAYGGSSITGGGMDWYKTVNLPAWTPAGSLIGLVWTIIFILLASAVLLAYNRAPDRAGQISLALLFLANIGLNVLWSYLFFGLHQIDWSLVEMFGLEFSVIYLMMLSWPVSRAASLMLLPYAAWVAFATYLTYIILSLNY